MSTPFGTFGVFKDIILLIEHAPTWGRIENQTLLSESDATMSWRFWGEAWETGVLASPLPEAEDV